jgi:hypothetical protein
LQRPTQRTIEQLRLLGLSLAPGTIADGLKRIESMMTPVYEATRSAPPLLSISLVKSSPTPAPRGGKGERCALAVANLHQRFTHTSLLNSQPLMNNPG